MNVITEWVNDMFDWFKQEAKVKKFLASADTSKVDPMIVQMWTDDPGSWTIADIKAEIKMANRMAVEEFAWLRQDQAEAAQMEAEWNEPVWDYTPPDCTLVAACLIDTKFTPAKKLGVKTVLCLRAGPWDHEHEIEVDGKLIQRLEGPYDEASWNKVEAGERDGNIVPLENLAPSLVEVFEIQQSPTKPVTVRARTRNTLQPDSPVTGKWSDEVILDTIFWRGAKNWESPAIEQLLGATDPSGRRPSRPKKPGKWSDKYVVKRLK